MGPVVRRARRLQAGPPVMRSVTDVLALTPSSQRFERRLAPVSPAGDFRLDLTPGRPWVIAFVDRNQVGEAMLVSVFRAETLDTLVPTSSGTLTLGDLAMTSSTATASVDYATVLAGLGLDASLALDLGAVDDVCLRYVNPDIDGNGVLDALEQDRRFMLDFHVQLEATRAGRRLTVADALGSFYDDTTSLRHQGTSVAASFQTSFSAADPRTTGWVRFESPLSMTAMGMGPPVDVEIPAGTPVTGDALIVFGWPGMTSMGVWARAGAELPQGRYRFGIGTDTLTFTTVRTRSAAALAAADGFILPFVRFDKVDATCTEACAIAGVSWVWRRHGAAGWRDATQSELDVFATPEGGYLSIHRGPQSQGQRIGVTLPSTAPSGSIPWAAASVRLEGTSAADLVNMTSSDLCHVGVSVDDALGMRYFVSMDDAPGTCR